MLHGHLGFSIDRKFYANVVGGLNLGGGIDPVYNAVEVAELATEKGATTLLVPISARRQLNELSDEMAMKLVVLYYSDAREALIKGLGEF